MQRHAKELIFVRHFLLWSVLTAVLVCLGFFCFDQPVAYAMRAFPPALNFFCTGVQFLFNPPKSYVFFPLAFFFAAVWTKKTRMINFLLTSVVAVPLANLITNALKIVLGRSRPELFFLEQSYGFFFSGTDFLHQSFPSGHATTIGAIAGAVSCFYPKKTALITLVALLLSFGRVAANVHFLSDILAGLFIGLTAAQWVYTKLERKLYNLRV